MTERVVPTGLNVAPTDQVTFGLGDDSWHTILQPLENELLHVFKRRRFQQREIATLTSDAI